MKLDKLLRESDIDKYLLPFLAPNTEGTEYWESQPPGELTNRQIGRICLQVHQLVERIDKTSPIKDISFLDIGTGNGLIPKLLPYFVKSKISHGCDPYLDGEHKTSFQKHERTQEFKKILSFIKNVIDKENMLRLENYSENIKNENFFNKPNPRKLFIDNPEDYKAYKFFQIGAHELDILKEKYDYLYCKAIEHIHNWDSVFQKAFLVSKPNAVFYLKHKSFFSYLGAHRYGSTSLPWGHLRMKESEYESYVDIEMPERASNMKDFFFNGLSYPRHPIGEMIKIASKFGWKLGSVEYEKSSHIESYQNFLFANNQEIYKEIKENHDVSYEEILSGMVHIIFTK